MHLRDCVLTCERVSHFCLNEEKKRKKASNTLPCVYVLVYSVHVVVAIHRHTAHVFFLKKEKKKCPCVLVRNGMDSIFFF